jgi:hypothetical protein
MIKKFKEENQRYVPELFLNAMIRNIKIHNMIDIIGFSKSIELNKCIHKRKIMKMFI